ncbi:MAG: class I SAM-dependent methyltransferase [Bacteroidetes bacterium]|nr:MAG: class I SAM-dependent methyltransferase [Bacteroidota bacterium]
MQEKEKTSKIPWPTKEAMIQIYEKKLWGDSDEFDYYSGEGSHKEELLEPYIDVVSSFLTSFDEPLTVCDLGCGDFNVGKRLLKYAREYVAVDIVPDLITYNRKKIREENLSFACMDLSRDELPTADCAILRQVLQHLSNDEVQQVTAKLRTYKYVLLTEHIPVGDFVPNLDIISGQGIRLKKQSGIDLLAPPFNLKVKKEKEILSITLPGNRGRIVTRSYEMY